MNRRTHSGYPADPKPVSPARGLLFTLGALSFFHGLITVVDPLL